MYCHTQEHDTLITRLFIFLSLIIASTPTSAVVIRDDIKQQLYIAQTKPNYLIDMPYEGHGALIAPQWILTVAHTIFDNYEGMVLSINEQNHEIEKVIIHKQYQAIPQELLQGHSQKIMAFLTHNHDIALVKLKSPVTGTAPILLYENDDEIGKTFYFHGRGATGTGVTGDIKATKADKVLRRGENTIIKSDNQWLIYQFDMPEFALPLEAMHGSGDSGAPAVIKIDGNDYLIGLMSWQYWLGPIVQYQAGLYGREAYQVRISNYIPWINEIINAH